MQASSSHLSLISGRSDSDPLLSERLDGIAPAADLYTAAGKRAASSSCFRAPCLLNCIDLSPSNRYVSMIQVVIA
jgi:hypothetical protein